MYQFIIAPSTVPFLPEEVEEVFPDVDDTDGLDPETEFEAWRLRELIRLKRERDAMLE